MKCVLFSNVVPVVTQHKSLNVSKGIVRNFEFVRTHPDEKKKFLNTIDVQCIVVKMNNVEV